MIVVFGSLNVDITARVDALPRRGETVPGRDLAVGPGGKGANQALAARRAGAQVAMAGAVGRDAFAEVALAPLRAAGIDVSLVEAVDAPTGTALRMDAGDVLCARTVAIDPEDDTGTLGGKLSALAAELLVEAVELIASGAARWTPQDEVAVTYAPMVRRDETRIDWALPAVDIERRIRAFRPDPAAFTIHDGARLKILAAAVAASVPDSRPGSIDADAAQGVRVACGDGSLFLTVVQPEGGRAIPARDYFRGRGAGRARVFGTSTE